MIGRKAKGRKRKGTEKGNTKTEEEKEDGGRGRRSEGKVSGSYTYLSHSRVGCWSRMFRYPFDSPIFP